MSTANKLTYLNTTKSKIRNTINITGANLTEENTFRSYASNLESKLVDIINNGTDDLYNNFPKVEGSGSDIELNNTYSSKMPMVFNGDTEQDSTTGKNLAYDGWAEDFVSRVGDSNKAEILNYDNRNCLKFSADAGYQDYDNKYIFKIKWEENIQYTFAFDLLAVTGYFNLYIEYTDGTGTFINGSQSANQWRSVAWSSEENKTIKYLRVRNISGYSYIDLDTFMIYKGTEATEYEPYTGGIASPNPDYPQDIKVVTGSQNIKVQNKNFLPFNNQNFTISGINFYCEDGKLYMNGSTTQEISSGNSNYKKQFAFTLPAGTYTFSLYLNQGNSSRISTQSGTTLCTLIGTGTSHKATFTLNEETDCYLGIYVYKQSYTNALYNAQLELNSDATTRIGHQEQNFPITLSSKNLFDGELELGSYSGTGTKIDNTNLVRSKNFIPVLPNKNYKFSLNGEGIPLYIQMYKSDYTFIERVLRNASQTLVTTEETMYITFRTYDETTNTSLEIMMNEGTKILPYTPYISIPIELCKIGNYKDRIFQNKKNNPYYDSTLDENEWYLHKEIGKVVLDGSEVGWYLNTNYTTSSMLVAGLGVANTPNIATGTANVKSTHFKYANPTIINSFRAISRNLGFGLDIIDFPDVDAWKNWLSSNNTTVYYQLATPTNTKITEEDYPVLYNQLKNIEKIISYEDKTYISVTCDDEDNLLLDLEVSALKKESEVSE